MEKFDWSKVEFARTPWRSRVIPDALPILIRWAQEGEAHSYSDLAQELHDTFGHEIKPRKDLYGTVAGEWPRPCSGSASSGRNPSRPSTQSSSTRTRNTLARVP